MLVRVMNSLSRRAGVRLFRFFSRPLQAGDALASLGGLRLRPIDRAEAVELCEDPELDLVKEKLSAAYARGDACVAAFEGTRLAAYCWLAFSPLPHLDGVWVAFDAGAVWTYKSFVRPAYRGRGIAPALYRFADGACRERGRGFSIICVEIHNRASIGAAMRARYSSAGYGGYARSRDACRSWMSAMAARQGVRFYLPDAEVVS